MKKTRLIYAFALLTSGALVFAYPNEYFAALFYLLLLLPVFSLAALSFVILRFKILHSLKTNRIIKGDNVVYTCSIFNEDIVPFPEMKIVFEGEHLIFHNQTLSPSFILMPKSKFDISLDLSCRYRGLYNIGVMYIEIKDFFNLFRIRFKNFAHMHVLVYPRVVYFKNLYITRKGNFENGNKDRRRTLSNQSMTEIKDYEYGEKLSLIHWKLSTRLGKLMTKKMESITEEKYTVYIDLYRSDLGYEENVVIEDKLIEVFVAFINAVLIHDIPVELHYMQQNEYKNETYVNHAQFDLFYENTAKMQFSKEVDLGSMMAFTKLKRSEMSLSQGKLFVFTFNLSPELVESLETKVEQGYETFMFMVSGKDLIADDPVFSSDEKAIIEKTEKSGVRIYRLDISDDIGHLLEGEVI